MILFFDCETTGLPRNYKAPVSDTANWPRLVQLAWLVCDEDGTELEAKDFIVKPEGFKVPDEAAKLHGVSDERARKEGHPLPLVLGAFDKALSGSDLLVAHNIAYDEKIVGSEFWRHGQNDPLAGKKKLCTMLSAVDFCRLPGNYGKYKWPKLKELHQKLFNCDFADAHNAIADIRATAKCFFELKKRGVIRG
jgi:DNA polymerase III subunit epsilon